MHKSFPPTHRLPTLWAVELRPYQIPIFKDVTTGILGLHWARQLGKSTVLAALAVDRLLTRPGRLVTVLSNSETSAVSAILSLRMFTAVRFEFSIY